MAYGKTGEETSFLYDPLYKYKTTVAGQMFICMWLEQMDAALNNMEIIQVNTDGISIIIDEDQLHLCRTVNDNLSKLTGLLIEETFYDKMVMRDVNNYLTTYSNSSKTKLKGCFEIFKEIHKDQSSTIVPIALEKYFVQGIPVEETIKNHKDIFDFCIRLKLKKSTKGIFTHVENGKLKKDVLPRTTRYYISNKGGTITKQFSDSGRVAGVNIGYKATLFNTYKNESDYRINYTYYIKECYKIIDLIEPNQLALF